MAGFPKRLNSLAEMAEELIRTEAREILALEGGLERIAQLIEKTAKAEFGVYQGAVGPFPAWAELADSTKADRVAGGFTENDPLLRDGKLLRDSIEHETSLAELETVIGSKEPVMLYQEVGTSRMPPRPVLGPAALRHIKAIQTLIAGAVLAGFVGKEMAYSALGYEFTVESAP